MGVARSVVGGFATGVAVGAVLSDPRKSARRVLAAILFAIGVIFTYFSCYTWVDGQGSAVGFAVTGVFWLFVILVSAAKFATRFPFSVFRFGSHLSASFSRSPVFRVTSFVAAGSYVLLIVACGIGAVSFAMLTATVVVMAVSALGVMSMGAVNNLVAMAVVVQDGVARALGANFDGVEVVNTGTLLNPELTASFAYVVSPENLESVQSNLAQALPSFRILGIDQTGVTLAQS